MEELKTAVQKAVEEKTELEIWVAVSVGILHGKIKLDSPPTEEVEVKLLEREAALENEIAALKVIAFKK